MRPCYRLKNELDPPEIFTPQVIAWTLMCTPTRVNLAARRTGLHVKFRMVLGVGRGWEYEAVEGILVPQLQRGAGWETRNDIRDGMIPWSRLCVEERVTQGQVTYAASSIGVETRAITQVDTWARVREAVLEEVRRGRGQPRLDREWARAMALRERLGVGEPSWQSG